MSAAMIAACLRAYMEHRKRRSETTAAAGAPTLRTMRADDLDLDRLFDPAGRVETLLEDPVRSALKGQVREIGWRLFVEGGMEALEQAAGEVEDLCPEAPSRAGAILDKWWDGVGRSGSHLGWTA